MSGAGKKSYRSGASVSTREPLVSRFGFASQGGTEYLSLTLDDDRIVMVPLALYPTLAAAPQRVRRAGRLIAGGEGISWAALDLDLSARGVIAGRPDMTRRARLSVAPRDVERYLRACVAHMSEFLTPQRLAEIVGEGAVPSSIKRLLPRAGRRAG